VTDQTDGDAPDAVDLDAAREALAAIGRRAEIAGRLELGGSEAVLRSIVEAAALLFEAEAASLALFDAARNVLVFRVAAGAQGQGVVGLEIPPDRGLVGYVFSTGQALAISDVARDPRFGRAFAEQTRYVPRSIVAVPLVDERGTIGVLEVLDKRTEATFSIRDVELAGVFARQASVAIRASRVERDVGALVGAVLRSLAGVEAPADGVETLVAAAVADVGGPDDPLWPLVERVAALRRASPDQLELVTALLDVLVRQAGRDAGGLRGGGARGAGGRGHRRRAPGR
jgi:GAF domain-containing protein